MSQMQIVLFVRLKPKSMPVSFVCRKNTNCLFNALCEMLDQERRCAKYYFYFTAD